MERNDAENILSEVEETFRKRSYSELQGLMNHPEFLEGKTANGAQYYVNVDAFWDDEKKKNLRVWISLDGGGWWRSFSPFVRCFIMAPDGSFVGDNVKAGFLQKIVGLFVMPTVLGLFFVLLIVLLYLAIGFLS